MNSGNVSESNFIAQHEIPNLVSPLQLFLGFNNIQDLLQPLSDNDKTLQL